MNQPNPEQPDLAWVADLVAKLQPFQPDPYHQWGPGEKTVEPLPVSYQALDGIPHEGDTWWTVFDAWCQYSAHGSGYHRETLLLSMAHRIRYIVKTEDQFQSCLKAVWEELGRWKTSYPVDRKTGEELHSDDIGKYLWTVARNAIYGGRKRKPVQVGDELVENTADTEAEHEKDSDNEAVVKGVCRDEIDERLLILKQKGTAESDMAKELNLSPDQVNRRLRRMYDEVCSIVELKPTSMGRNKPKGGA